MGELAQFEGQTIAQSSDRSELVDGQLRYCTIGLSGMRSYSMKPWIQACPLLQAGDRRQSAPNLFTLQMGARMTYKIGLEARAIGLSC
jgi:hypothetical protein